MIIFILGEGSSAPFLQKLCYIHNEQFVTEPLSTEVKDVVYEGETRIPGTSWGGNFSSTWWQDVVSFTLTYMFKKIEISEGSKFVTFSFLLLFVLRAVLFSRKGAKPTLKTRLSV